ncbi:hypothetical protein D0X99_19570 [Algoriphagus lacus]|uniref:Uncharacterized protein n=1 Tax=Algoriphagus lacus TaxID=2056311 RepID=A0A418PM35_9BACT|nr:hypothetical protein [Algoriphagus lacus]RIW12284.1 hypothetical protein D0X99_19570 [Algoriphagus lacus]
MNISVISFLSFCLLTFLLSILRFSNFSRFESVIFFLILWVSGFAVWVTKGFSIFTLSFIGIIVVLVNNRSKIRIYSLGLFQIYFPIVFFVLFYFIYYVFSNFSLSYPHEDYLIYERIGYYNYLYEVENTRTFYNVISKIQPKMELYHFFEIWAATLLTQINGLKFLENFILVLCPVMIWITWLGFLELFPEKRVFMIIGILFSILIFINPYDIVIEFFEFPLPISGLGGILFHLKYLFVLPILLFVLIQLKKSNTNYLIFSVISFLYLLVFPVLLASLILYDFYKKRLSWRTFFIPIFLGLFFIALSLILNRDPIFPKTDIMHFNNFFLVSKVFIMGLFFPSVLFLIILKLVKANDFQKSLVLFFTFTSFIGSFLWVLYSDNIDANQLYRNSISSFFPLTLFVLIEKFFDHVFFNILDLALCSILLFFFIL